MLRSASHKSFMAASSLGKWPRVLMAFLNGVDLIYDATAERGIQFYFASLAKVRNIPYVMAESRPGGWGGLVARIRPSSGAGCYTCLFHALSDGKTIEEPPSKEEDFIQPQGCISPTFTASSFDTSTVSLAGVRLAISTLCEGQNSSYPAIEHDIGVLSLRNTATGFGSFPVWKTYPLAKHPSCGCSK